MKIHISFYVNYCKVLAFCFVKEVHNVLRLLHLVSYNELTFRTECI